MLDRLSPQRRRFVLGSTVAGIAVLVAIVIALQPEEQHAPAGLVPVMLVHGYAGTPASMQTLARALRHEHRVVRAVALPQFGEADINESSTTLARAVQRTGAAKVDLVGFSAGSIVVRRYLSSATGTREARRVVLLGAPNHGAAIASLAVSTDPSGCVDACRQLARDSSFLQRLNSHPLPAGVAVVSIWTDADMVVTPPTSAVLPGATNIQVQRVCPHAALAHGDLVVDPIAIGLTVKALKGRADDLQGCGQIRRIGVDALNS